MKLRNSTKTSPQKPSKSPPNLTATADLLRGYFTGSLVKGFGPKTVNTLTALAQLEDQNPTDLIEQHLPTIAHFRNIHQPHSNFDPYFDQAMNQHCFLWSDTSQTYIKL